MDTYDVFGLFIGGFVSGFLLLFLATGPEVNLGRWEYRWDSIKNWFRNI